MTQQPVDYSFLSSSPSSSLTSRSLLRQRQEDKKLRQGSSTSSLYSSALSSLHLPRRRQVRQPNLVSSRSSSFSTSPYVVILCQCFMLFTLLFLLSSPTSAAEESIQWPKAVDSFDEYLINLVKQYHHLENVNRRRRDVSEDDDLLSPTTPAPKSTTAAPGNGTVKNFTIDWNEVDKKWKETISEEEVAKKWTDMEKGLKNGIRSLLRTIFPQVVSMSSDAKVSGNCSAGMLKWIISLRHLKGWAIKMFDAMGKPGAGMLEGSLTMFGNHRQCLDIRAPDDEDDFEDDVSIDEATGKPKFKEFFRGQYCMLELKPWLPEKPRFYGLEGGRSAIKALERDPNDDTVSATVKDIKGMILTFHTTLETFCHSCRSSLTWPSMLLSYTLLPYVLISVSPLSVRGKTCRE